MDSRRGIRDSAWGRSVLMIMAVLNECAQKGIQIRTIKDNFDLSGRRRARQVFKGHFQGVRNTSQYTFPLPEKHEKQ